LIRQGSLIFLLFLWTVQFQKTCAFAFPSAALHNQQHNQQQHQQQQKYSSAWTKRSFLATTTVAASRLSTKNGDNDNAADDDDDDDNGFDQVKFTQQQKEASSKIRQQDAHADPTTNMSEISDEYHHLQHQQRVFDDLSAVFGSGDTVPAKLVVVYEHLAFEIVSTVVNNKRRAVRLAAEISGASATETTASSKDEEPTTTTPIPVPETFRLLDVATGTGAMYAYYVAAADQQRSGGAVSLQITGIDLSTKMVQLAKDHALQVLVQEQDGSDSKHEISVVTGDILQYTVDNDDSDDSDSGLYDAIVANACFGNFWDQAAVLQHLTSLLKLNGSLFITHPLGADFVAELHRSDADTVPHLLPTFSELHAQTLCLPLVVSDFVEEADMSIPMTTDDAYHEDAQVPIYYAAMTKVRDSFLPNIIRLRGTVDTGYGRGGKKLGFPTANLPSRLFQDALQDVPTGVYFGWAVIENDSSLGGEKKGRNTYQKAVVNVGYSPTFEGQENSEKIVEAHLMMEPGAMEPADFYSETMRLQLHSYLRPEIKFPSFPALIAQIKADVADAKAALDQETNMLLQADGFLADVCGNNEEVWIGKDGGDATASWEFQKIQATLQHLR
jgi:riboflavin kinase